MVAYHTIYPFINVTCSRERSLEVVSPRSEWSTKVRKLAAADVWTNMDDLSLVKETSHMQNDSAGAAWVVIFHAVIHWQATM